MWEHSHSVDNYLRHLREQYKIPGLSVAVVKEGEFIFNKGYGLKSVEFDLPADEFTIYQIASVSKIFSGTAAMILVEQEALSLDTPIIDILPDLPQDWKDILVWHLFNHTSGLQDPFEDTKPYLPDNRWFSDPDLNEMIGKTKREFSPGERWVYSRAGYMLLGMIIEAVSGESFTGFMQRFVFSPSGMTSAKYGGSDVMVKGRPAGAYHIQEGVLKNWIWTLFEADYPSAGLNVSAADVARFLWALDTGLLLKPQSLRKMWTQTRLNSGDKTDYGLGWSVGTYKGFETVGHEGGGCAWALHFPERHLSIAVLSNLAGSRADEIQFGIADLYL